MYLNTIVKSFEKRISHVVILANDTSKDLMDRRVLEKKEKRKKEKEEIKRKKVKKKRKKAKKDKKEG